MNTCSWSPRNVSTVEIVASTVGHREPKIWPIPNPRHSAGKSWNDWFSSVPSTPTTENYAANEVSRPKRLPRKKYKIFKILKIDVFFIFFEFSKSGFSWFWWCFWLITIRIPIETVLAVGQNRYVEDFARKSSVGTAVFRMPRVITTTGVLLRIDINDFCQRKFSDFFFRFSSEDMARVKHQRLAVFCCFLPCTLCSKAKIAMSRILLENRVLGRQYFACHGL